MFLETLLNIRSEALIAICVALLAYALGAVIRRAKSNFPPGPVGLPIVGYLPFLTENAHLKFMELGKKYGDVFSVRLGSETVVVLNGASVIREAFAKSEFLGRPPTSAFELFDNTSPFFAAGIHVWQEQRKFVVQSMKDLGLGKSKIEGHIQDEINHFLEVLRTKKGKPMDLKPLLTPSMSNNICALTFGKRYDYHEPDRMMMDNLLNQVSRVIGQTAGHIFFPWIRYIPFVTKLLKYEEAMVAFKRMNDFFRKKIQMHKETLDPMNIRDFIDSYLVEMKSRKAKDPSTTFTDDCLLGIVGDMFGAGSETVRTSILWCTYIMAAYPTIQKKVQREIADVLGADRSPEFFDQKLMPFTHATLLEVMRWKTVVPLNLLRYTLSDTTVGNYQIPKGTIVMANLWAPHHDARNWEDPDSFNPERFLGPDGKSILKSNNYMPFSVGKRICPGETMANMEIFLYFVSILQKFNIALPDGVKPTFDSELTITYGLKPHEIRFIPRN